MRFVKILTLTTLFLSSLCAWSQAPKGKLFIIGGGSRPDAMIQRLIQESGLDKGGFGIVLPMSSAEQDSSVYYATRPFIQLGVKSLRGIYFTAPNQATQSMADSIRKAKLIYITGGDQTRFMNIVGGTVVEQAIQDAYRAGATIAGTSAGAAVMSKKMITGNQLKYPEYASTFSSIEENNLEITKGLGLIEQVIVDQHFLIRSRHNRLITAVIENSDYTGIGIDESTAILVIGKGVEVVGISQVLVLRNSTKSKRTWRGKLAASELSLNIYLPGDKFTL